MCRLLGVVSSEATEFRFSLHEAPRSLAKLSAEHPHGWGLAVHSDGDGWTVEKQAAEARACDRFREAAHRARGEILLAHVRKRTVGPIGVENTHPFRRGEWVFAHNGTIEDRDWLEHDISPARRAEIEGDTDSERYFAKILTRVDEDSDVDKVLRALVAGMPAHGKAFAANFLLSNGRALWAFRMGRTLFALERHRGDPVRTRRTSREASLDTPWSPRRHAFLVASEAMSDEPWRELPEGTLVRIDKGATPRLIELS